MIKEQYIDAITTVMNVHLTQNTFPDIWKVSRLVLIEKPRKSEIENRTYRPICVMDRKGPGEADKQKATGRTGKSWSDSCKPIRI